MEIMHPKKVAVAFYLIEAENGVPVYFPIKPMIGDTDDNNRVFTDAFTGRKYLHITQIAGLDEEECFALNGDIEELIESTKEPNLEGAMRKLWERMDSRAFIYGSVSENPDMGSFSLYPLEDETYTEFFGYSLKDEQLTQKENNDLIDDLIAGKISEKDYAYYLEHHEFPNKEKCKIIEFKFPEQP